MTSYLIFDFFHFELFFLFSEVLTIEFLTVFEEYDVILVCKGSRGDATAFRGGKSGPLVAMILAEMGLKTTAKTREATRT